MPKIIKKKNNKKSNTLYVVHKGKTPGIYKTWPECQEKVAGFQGAVYRKCFSQEEAQIFLENGFRGLKDKEKEDDENDLQGDQFIIYTDGACKGNGKKDGRSIVGGCGVYFGADHKYNTAVPFVREPITNQRTEIFAVFLALSTVKLDRELRKKTVWIHTDSNYLLTCIHNRHRWKARNYFLTSGEKCKNLDILLPLFDLLDELGETEGCVKFKHVYGHGLTHGNNEADRLANVGAAKAKDLIISTREKDNSE